MCVYTHMYLIRVQACRVLVHHPVILVNYLSTLAICTRVIQSLVLDCFFLVVYFVENRRRLPSGKSINGSLHHEKKKKLNDNIGKNVEKKYFRITSSILSNIYRLFLIYLDLFSAFLSLKNLTSSPAKCCAWTLSVLFVFQDTCTTVPQLYC